MGIGAVLERVSQVGTDADGLVYKNKCTRQPSVIAEWGGCAGGSTGHKSVWCLAWQCLAS